MYLELTANYLNKSKCYKQAIDIYNQVLMIYSSTYQISKLKETYNRAGLISESLLKDPNPPTFKFFRVSLYGKIFNNFNGKSFVYREKFNVRIAKFKDKILVKKKKFFIFFIYFIFLLFYFLFYF